MSTTLLDAISPILAALSVALVAIFDAELENIDHPFKKKYKNLVLSGFFLKKGNSKITYTS